MKRYTLVEVSQAAYSAYINSITGAEGFFEGRDVGRTHGVGCVYLGDKLVAEWSWHLDHNRQRKWSYKIPRSVILGAMNEAGDSQ